MITAKLVLWTYQKPTAKGYPIKVLVTEDRKTKPYNLKLYSSSEDWNEEANEPEKSHPRFRFVQKQVRKTKGKIEDLLDVAYEKGWTKEDFIEELSGQKERKRKGNSDQKPTFFKFGAERVKELRENKKDGNAQAYELDLRSLKKYNLDQDLQFEKLDYSFLTNFKNYHLSKGNSPNYVHRLFRTYRALYNEAINRSIVDKEHYPFKRGLMPKRRKTAKRNISKKDILKLENATGLRGSRLEARNYYLMMFYLGGMELVDISNLTKDNIINGRLIYQRTKLDGTGLEIDLRVFPKMHAIIDFYEDCSSVYLFPITSSLKDYSGYRRDYGRINKNMKALGKELGIELKLTTKTARHSFSTIGKRLYIDPEMLKELMGHEGNEVADVYKDRFPQKDRDRDHWKIIKT